MVQAGRVACIFTPFVLTLACLVCLVVVFLAGTIQHSSTLGDLYFMKIDLRNFTLTSSANLVGSGNNGNLTVLEGALQKAKQSLGMKDFYTIYLRNYCAWNGGDTYAYCSPKEARFYFNPIEVWGLNSTGYDVDAVLPTSIRDGLATYRAASSALFYLYVIALATTVLTILVSISAIMSRWGSFVTTAFSAISGLVFIGASVLAAVMFSVLAKTLNTTLKEDYGIDSTTGTRVLALTWIGVAFAVGSTIFWLLSVCCCSGRSPYNPGSKDARRTRAEKTPYTYERVGSPYLGPRDSQAIPLNTLNQHTGYAQGPQGQKDTGTAYEPFRPQQV